MTTWYYWSVTVHIVTSPYLFKLVHSEISLDKASGGSRISPRRGRQLSGGGRQHTILPNFPKNCMKLKEFGLRGGCPKFYYVDPPLKALNIPYPYSLWRPNSYRKAGGRPSTERLSCIFQFLPILHKWNVFTSCRGVRNVLRASILEHRKKQTNSIHLVL